MLLQTSTFRIVKHICIIFSVCFFSLFIRFISRKQLGIQPHFYAKTKNRNVTKHSQKCAIKKTKKKGLTNRTQNMTKENKGDIKRKAYFLNENMPYNSFFLICFVHDCFFVLEIHICTIWEITSHVLCRKEKTKITQKGERKTQKHLLYLFQKQRFKHLQTSPIKLFASHFSPILLYIRCSYLHQKHNKHLCYDNAKKHSEGVNRSIRHSRAIAFNSVGCIS